MAAVVVGVAVANVTAKKLMSIMGAHGTHLSNELIILKSNP